MNILILTARESNPFIGGIEKVTDTLTRRWKMQGCNVFHLAVEKSSWEQSVVYHPSAEQYFLPESHSASAEVNLGFVIELIKEKQIEILLNQATIREDVVDLCNQLKKYSSVKLVSALHFAPNAEYQIAKNNLFLNRGTNGVMSFVKSIANFLYFYLINGKRIKERERRTLEKICQGSEKVIVLSEKYIPAFRKIFDSDKYMAIPNPLVPVGGEVYSKKKQLLYAARIEYGCKRFDRMLDIWDALFRDFPEWELVVIGDGEYLSHFKNETQRRGIRRVRYEGFCNPEPFYKTAAILCLTSTCEGFVMVLLEGMQFGCVPIAYNSYLALEDIIKDGTNGFAVQAFDKNEFVGKLSSLMKDPKCLNRMSEEALKYPMKFDANLIALRWVDLFKSLI